MTEMNGCDGVTIKLALNAMATRFELVLQGESESRLRGAGEEALEEIQRLEAQLSLYQPTSEIARVNARAAQEKVRISPPVFALLQQAQALHEETGGAFDITVAPLVRCWGFMGGSGHMPDPDELARARSCIGMERVHLDEEDFSVRFEREGVMLDLGAIGKGYAIDRAAILLREAGVSRALLHGGTSTVYAIGKPMDGDGWQIAIERPTGTQSEPGLLARVNLEDEALSVSAVWGRAFEHEGKTFGHVLDPRTAHPVSNALLSAVALPSATETDALSTALLVAGMEGHEAIARLRHGMRSLVVVAQGTGFHAESKGIALSGKR